MKDDGMIMMTQLSLYNKAGKIDITARRNAIAARMKESNTAQVIWNERMDE